MLSPALSCVLSSRLFKIAVPGSLACAVLLAGCDRQSGPQPQPEATAPAPSSRNAGAPEQGTLDRSQKGKAIPGLTVSDPAGKTLALASLKGKPLLVNLWATWCAPCVAELPTLDALAEKRGDSLRVLTVSQDMQAEKVVDFLKEKGGAHLEPWLDPKSDLAFAFGAQTLPTTIYFDAQGREIWRMVGGHDWSSTETARLLDEAS